MPSSQSSRSLTKRPQGGATGPDRGQHLLCACAIVLLVACSNSRIELFPDGRGDTADGGLSDSGGGLDATDVDEAVLDATVVDARSDASDRDRFAGAADAPPDQASDVFFDDAADASARQDAGGRAGVPCSSDKDCRTSFDTPLCDPTFSVCVQCFSDSTCAGSPESKCNPVSGTCVRPCATDIECSVSDPADVCDHAYGACADCVGDLQCPPDQPKCYFDTCVQCVDSRDCREGGACSPTTLECH